ncbi:MAG: hypothetical protein AVDCRST_MAG04-3928, partial [uncultured Acetobacteraceae bacterium]
WCAPQRREVSDSSQEEPSPPPIRLVMDRVQEKPTHGHYRTRAF